MAPVTAGIGPTEPERRLSPSSQSPILIADHRRKFTRGTIGGSADTARVQVGIVGPGFFQALLGTAPQIGRGFEAADFAATVRAIVISHSLWQQRFASDPKVIGRSIQLNDATVEIVGVIKVQWFRGCARSVRSFSCASGPLGAEAPRYGRYS